MKPLIGVPYTNESDKQRIETQLRQLHAHPGWAILVSQLKLLREYAQDEINKPGGDQVLKYGEAEISRRDLITLDMLIDFPMDIIESLAQEKVVPHDDNEDPYDDMEELYPM